MSSTPDTSTWVQRGIGWWTLKGVGTILRTNSGWDFIPTQGKAMSDFETIDDAKKAAILRAPSEGWTREQAGDWQS